MALFKVIIITLVLTYITEYNKKKTSMHLIYKYLIFIVYYPDNNLQEERGYIGYIL